MALLCWEAEWRNVYIIEASDGFMVYLSLLCV